MPSDMTYLNENRKVLPVSDRLQAGLGLKHNLKVRKLVSKGLVKQKLRHVVGFNSKLILCLVSSLAAMPLLLDSFMALLGIASPVTPQMTMIASSFLLATAYKPFLALLRGLFTFQMSGHALIALGVLAATVLSAAQWIGTGVINASWMVMPALSLPLLYAAPFIARRAISKNIILPNSEILYDLPSDARPKSTKGLAMKVPLGRIQAGDIVKLLPNEICPVDGIITEGVGDFAGGWVTGDTLPRSKAPGERVFAGEHNLNGTLSIQALRGGHGSNLYESLKYSGNVKRRAFRDPARAKLIKRYTWFLLFIAVSAGFAIAYKQADALAGAKQALLTLVLGAPVGLGLMSSLPLYVVSKALKKYGVFLHDMQIADKARKLTQIIISPLDVFVKRSPSMGIIQSLNGEEQLDHLKLTHAIMKASKHALTKSVEQVLTVLEVDVDQAIEFDRIREVPGQGIVAELGERKFLLGNIALLSQMGVGYRRYDRLAYEIERVGHMAIWLAEAGVVHEPKAIIEFAPSVRPSSGRAMKALKEMDLEVMIAPGLATSKMAESLKRLSIDGFINAHSVQDMLKSVNVRQQRGDKICFVGASSFDLAAMRAADIAVAPADGPQLITESAPITMRVTDPALVVKTLRMCRTASLKSLSALWTMFGLSIMGMSIAMLGFVTPKIYLVYALVSVLVVMINSMLILKD